MRNKLQNLILVQAHVVTKVTPGVHTVWVALVHVLEQAAICLQSLQMDRVDLLYLHAPDHNIPIEETLGAIQELYEGIVV